MDFALYEPEDFASNESYLRYYFRLNDADISFWQDWIRNHPEKLDCIINADHLISILALQLDEDELSQEYQRLYSSIENGMAEEESAPVNARQSITSSDINTKTKTRVVPVLLLVATTIIILVCFFVYRAPVKEHLSNINVTKHDTEQLLRKVNSSNQSLKFQLEDGSIITLQPGSALNYPYHFLALKREVFLEGEAFFEITKNKKRPFYVYCQNLVAHVLGTSFNVRTDRIHGKVEVAVSTGRVEVYQKNKKYIPGEDKKSDGLILTPNQKAVYLEENHKFESSLVDVPLPIAYSSQDITKDSAYLETVNIKSAAIKEILKSLEKTYGIEIEVENKSINSCHFLGDLVDMNLYIKLDLICQSINATYEVKGTKILIRGKGCN